jgi:hypothetical protein
VYNNRHLKTAKLPETMEITGGNTMPKTEMHLAEAVYSYSGRKVLVALAPGQPPYSQSKAQGRVYHEVPIEIWERFEAIPGDMIDNRQEHDAFFHVHFEGKFDEQVFDFETYQRIRMLGPSQIPPRSNLPNGPLC